MDFGDAPQAGNVFPTTLANGGARHILGSGLFLGGGVDADADGQPDAGAAGDDNAGDDEDGVTFAAVQAGTNAGVTVTATVPGTAVLNAWIDFNADGDWADLGEQVFVDQALAGAVNNLTAAIPSGAALGSTFARFRVTGTAGYSYFGLAPGGEVEDYQITIAATTSQSPGALSELLDTRAASLADDLLNPWPAGRISPDRQIEEPIYGSEEPTDAQIIDLAIAEEALAERTPPEVIEDPTPLDEHLLDHLFEEQPDLLSQDDGFGGDL